MLLVSGGHCQFLIVKGAERFERIGGTIDDAPGEAFDKAARLLGLAQPGGPAIEAAAKTGNPKAFSFPRPLLDRPGCDLSFSGLKTAILRARDQLVSEQSGLFAQDVADFCASFQSAVGDVLAEKSKRALDIYLSQNPQTPIFCVAGGVAANQTLRAKLTEAAQGKGAEFIAPPLALCDVCNIAYAGAERYLAETRSDGFSCDQDGHWIRQRQASSGAAKRRKGRCCSRIRCIWNSACDFTVSVGQDVTLWSAMPKPLMR